MVSGDDGGGRERKIRVDYPSNSKTNPRIPQEKEPVEKIVTGDVVMKKRSLSSKIFGDFIAEDSGSVVGFVLTEVLLPAAKNMISDAFSTGVDRLLFGDSRPRPAGTNRGAYTNYGSRFPAARYIPGSTTNATPSLSRQARATHDFNDVIIASRADAEDVIDRLRDLINQFEVATVSDFYDLVGLTGEFTDNKWGWYDLRSAQVRAVRGGYMLHLPRTESIA